MKMPRIKEWSEGGNTLYRSAHISMESTALPLWLIDKWLWIADEVVHFIERRMPKDERGWSAIDNLTPYWGNPFCAAYLHKWGRWYRDQQKREVWAEIPFEKLSQDTRAWLAKDEADMEPWKLCSAHLVDRKSKVHTDGEPCDISLYVMQEFRT